MGPGERIQGPEIQIDGSHDEVTFRSVRFIEETERTYESWVNFVTQILSKPVGSVFILNSL